MSAIRERCIPDESEGTEKQEAEVHAEESIEERAKRLGGRVMHGVSYAGEDPRFVYIPPSTPTQGMQEWLDRPA